VGKIACPLWSWLTFVSCLYQFRWKEIVVGLPRCYCAVFTKEAQRLV